MSSWPHSPLYLQKPCLACHSLRKKAKVSSSPSKVLPDLDYCAGGLKWDALTRYRLQGRTCPPICNDPVQQLVCQGASTEAAQNFQPRAPPKKSTSISLISLAILYWCLLQALESTGWGVRQQTVGTDLGRIQVLHIILSLYYFRIRITEPSWHPVLSMKSGKF